MNDPQSPDSLQKSVQGKQPNQSATLDATGPYVASTSTESERKLTQPLPNAPTIPGYVITGIIAKGGMGVVYSALDLKFNREVAIKILLPGSDAERFVTEAKITARLPHPAIPPVHDLGELGDVGDGSRWLAMKLIRGQTLHTLLPSPARGRGAGGEGELDRPRLIQIFEQIAQAVGFAHSRGIIHRDLKPLNVMVGEFGEVQVMDWGLAKDVCGPSSIAHRGEQSQATGDGQWATDDGQHTAFGAIMGTPGYMAPEQARGEVVDARADVFALGWDPPADAYDAAAFLCMCIPIVARHTHLDEDKKKEAQTLYADEAMKLLRHAVETGFHDAAKLKGDGTFAPLRPREDFQKLLAELETKGKN
jgi:serine/threonine protein kinase